MTNDSSTKPEQTVQKAFEVGAWRDLKFVVRWVSAQLSFRAAQLNRLQNKAAVVWGSIPTGLCLQEKKNNIL